MTTTDNAIDTAAATAPRIVTVDMDLLKARLAERAADPTTQKVGIAAAAAAAGALAYHLLAG